MGIQFSPCGCCSPPTTCTLVICVTGCGGLGLPGVALSVAQGALPPATGTTGSDGCATIPYTPGDGQLAILVTASRTRFVTRNNVQLSLNCDGTPVSFVLTPSSGFTCSCCSTTSPIPSSDPVLTDVNGTHTLHWDGTAYRCAYTFTVANTYNCFSSGSFLLCVQYALLCDGTLTLTWFEALQAGVWKYLNGSTAGDVCQDIVHCSGGATGTAVVAGTAITGQATCQAFSWSGTLSSTPNTGNVGTTPVTGTVAISST